MNLARAIHKLRKMPVAEIRHRIGERARTLAERRAYRRPLAASPGGRGSTIVHGLTARAVERVPGCARDEITRLYDRAPRFHEALAEQAVDRAEAICGGQYRLLNCPVDLSGAIEWHRCPKSDFTWPRQFYADVKMYGRDDEVDVKFVWELGRHHFLVELSRAWLFSDEPRYADRARSLMLDWIEQNPVYEGVHWTSALEVAMRSIAWLWTVAGLGEWPGWQANDHRRIARSLEEHAEYLSHHLSFYSSPYNHLIGEATALLLLSRWLRGAARSESWERLARKVLAEHGPKQFYGDGFTVEKAVGYHFYVLGFLLQAVLAARSSGEPLEELERVMPNALEAAARLRQPGGRWPAVGDIDSARSVPVYPEDPWDFSSFCSLAAVVGNSAEAKQAAGQAGAELFWLLGVDGVASFERLDDEPAPRTAVLPQSGFAVARSTDKGTADWLLFEAGPLGDGVHSDATPSVAHGHAAPLNLLVHRAGRPLLVDSGTLCYAGDRRWVEHYRLPAAHNTIEVDGETWARPAGGLAWSHAGETPKLDANLSDDAWLLRGRLTLSGGTTVTRNVLGLPGRGVWIADLIQSSAPRRCTWYWQFPADVGLELQRTWISGSEATYDGEVLATISDSEGVDAIIDSAEPDSPVAWRAWTYGARLPGLRLTHRAEACATRMNLTYVGPGLVPTTVTLGERSLSLGTSEELPIPTDRCTADVVWSVQFDEQITTFAGGMRAASSKDGWTGLDEAGEWPAAKTLSACGVTSIS